MLSAHVQNAWYECCYNLKWSVETVTISKLTKQFKKQLKAETAK